MNTMPTFLRSTSALALACSMALAACGGSDGDPGAPGAAGGPGLSALSAVFAEPAGTHCAEGGARIDAGLDTNANQVLDTGEVASTQYLCQGGSGAAANASLVRLAAEAAGAHCTHGGTRVDVGVDTNTNGTLDTAEVVSTAYVCGTAAGTPGATGPAGAAGTAGVTSLTTIAPEPAGANCPAGGLRATTGPDTNRNGVLDVTELATSTYLCHGTSGVTLQWVTVTAASAQTTPNTGYIASSAAEVVLTLPATASLQAGDVVRVTGNGSGGWRLAQNAGQSILTGGLPATYRTLDTGFTALPQTGILSSGTAIASSSDGSRLLATGFGDWLWVSANAGQSWSARESQRNWTSVASSADGLTLVAAAGSGQLFVSWDGGLAWSARGPSATWTAVTSSADGKRLVAGSDNGEVFTSTDAGVTWSSGTDLGLSVIGLASSADGSRLFAVLAPNVVQRSLDGGATWTPDTVAHPLNRIASSADGTRLIAAGPGSPIYISADSGSTWTTRHQTQSWMSVASSADGRRLVASDAATHSLHVSNDFGITWVQRGPSIVWESVALSADGSRLAALSYTALWVDRQDRSTTGITGAVSGGPDESLELQYIGGGQFLPTRHTTGSGTFQVD